MSFVEYVNDVRGCAGVLATAIADREGIPVEMWGGAALDMDEVIAQYSTFLREVASANRELQLGGLDQLLVAGVRRIILVTSITDEHFLITVVDRSGNTGKARFACRIAAARLRQEFI